MEPGEEERRESRCFLVFHCCSFFFPPSAPMAASKQESLESNQSSLSSSLSLSINNTKQVGLDAAGKTTILYKLKLG